MKNTAPIEARSLVPVVLSEEERAVSLAERMKAFCDPTRLRILRILAGMQECIVNLNRLVELIGGLNQSGISRHVRVLLQVGCLRRIESRKKPRGKQRHYLVDRQVINQLLTDLLSYTGCAIT